MMAALACRCVQAARAPPVAGITGPHRALAAGPSPPSLKCICILFASAFAAVASFQLGWMCDPAPCLPVHLPLCCYGAASALFPYLACSSEFLQHIHMHSAVFF